MSHVEENARELERLTELVGRLTDDDLDQPVTDQWSVADVLGHMAFWDARALALAEKLDGKIPFTESDHEPADVDVLNAAAARLVQAIPRRQAAELALQMARQVDALVARLPAEKMWPDDRGSPLNCFRANHRSEHLGDIEEALESASGGG